MKHLILIPVSILTLAAAIAMLSSCAHASPMPGENHWRKLELFNSVHFAHDKLAASIQGPPKCQSQTTNCRNRWYFYGDLTGDYGVIDAAD